LIIKFKKYKCIIHATIIQEVVKDEAGRITPPPQCPMDKALEKPSGTPLLFSCGW
jgi:hypothetical protein